MAVDGLTTIASNYAPKETMDRLEAAVKARGMTVFARVDHAAGAQAVGLPLRPTQMLIFGNPRAGTPLMQAQQTVGLDLPLRGLAREDEEGKAWLTYNDPSYLARRHGVAGQEATVRAMTAGLQALARAATEP